MSPMQQKVNEKANVEMENERKVSKLNLSILFLKFLNINLKYILEAPAGLFWGHLFVK